MRSLQRDGETDSPLALWLVVFKFIFQIEDEKQNYGPNDNNYCPNLICR